MRPSRIQAVEHADLQARLGTEEELRWFYGELAGLEELCSNDADFPRLRFKSEHIEIRLRMWPDLEIDPIEIRNTPDLWQDKYDDMLTGIIMRRELEARLEFSAIAAKPQPVVLTSMETMP